jgi:hypothetical protein
MCGSEDLVYDPTPIGQRTTGAYCQKCGQWTQVEVTFTPAAQEQWGEGCTVHSTFPSSLPPSRSRSRPAGLTASDVQGAARTPKPPPRRVKIPLPPFG